MLKALGMIVLAVLLAGCDPVHTRGWLGGKPSAEAATSTKQKVKRKAPRRHRQRVPVQAEPTPRVIAPPPIVAPPPEPPRIEPPAPPPVPAIEAPKPGPAKPKANARWRAWDWFLRH